MKKPYLSVVIPAYNEAKNFHDGLLDPAIKYLARQKYDFEVIFVNDGSTDNTEKLLTAFCRAHSGYRLKTIAHGGKAAAVTAGMLAAKGEIILFTDFDQSTPLYQVEKFIEVHKNGADIVIGDRNVINMNNKVLRRIRSWVFLILVQTVLLPGVRDSQCGFKSFKNNFAKKIFKNLLVTKSEKVLGGYMGAFDVEALFLGQKLGAKIEQVPVEWNKVEGTRLNPLIEPLKMIRDVFKIKIFGMLGKYDNLTNTTAN
jgi:glycosyltransferase involved in cell wall biosynthesis